MVLDPSTLVPASGPDPFEGPPSFHTLAAEVLPPGMAGATPPGPIRHAAWDTARDDVIAALSVGRSVAILGVSGVGKSLLLTDLFRTLTAAGRRVSLIRHAEMDGELDVDVLLLDEADRLTPERLVALYRRPGRCVLAGLPPLAQAAAALIPTPAVVLLPPLDLADVRGFVAAHLRRTRAAVHDGPDGSMIDDDAVAALAAESACVPRTLQILAGLASFAAGMEASDGITERHVRAAVALRYGTEAPGTEDAPAHAGVSGPDPAAPAVRAPARSPVAPIERAFAPALDLVRPAGVRSTTTARTPSDGVTTGAAADTGSPHPGPIPHDRAGGSRNSPLDTGDRTAALAARPVPPWGPSRNADGARSRPRSRGRRIGRAALACAAAGLVVAVALVAGPLLRTGVLERPRLVPPDQIALTQPPVAPRNAPEAPPTVPLIREPPVVTDAPRAMPEPAMPANDPGVRGASASGPTLGARTADLGAKPLIPAPAPAPPLDAAVGANAVPAPSRDVANLAPTPDRRPVLPDFGAITGPAGAGEEAAAEREGSATSDSATRASADEPGLPVAAVPRILVTFTGRDPAAANAVVARLGARGVVTASPRPRRSGEQGVLFFFAEDAAAARMVAASLTPGPLPPGSAGGPLAAGAPQVLEARPSARPVRIADTPPGTIEVALPAVSTNVPTTTPATNLVTTTTPEGELHAR